MEIKCFAFVEDYIEYIAGYDPSEINSNYQFHAIHNISLARHDFQIVSGIAQQTRSAIALTDRQAELSVKLIQKYQKQFRRRGVECGSILTLPSYRIPLRIVDRSRTITVTDDSITIRFPFDPLAIERLSLYRKESIGAVTFNKQDRCWEAAITEKNIQWISNFAAVNHFDTSSTFKELESIIDECAITPYAIELTQAGDELTITNAPSTLLDYVNNVLGGLERSNLLRLIDNSPIVGYTINANLMPLAANDDTVNEILLNRELYIPAAKTQQLKEIVEYATLVNRWPIFVFDSKRNVSDIKQQLEEIFSPDEILDDVGTSIEFPTLQNKTKCVYLTDWRTTWDTTIPLLISTTSMMYGARKKHMVQCAEKVVYVFQTAYNII